MDYPDTSELASIYSAYMQAALQPGPSVRAAGVACCRESACCFLFVFELEMRRLLVARAVRGGSCSCWSCREGVSPMENGELLCLRCWPWLPPL